MKTYRFNERWMVAATGNMVGALLGEEISLPKPVTLPHDAMIALPRNPQNPSQNSGAFFPGGDYTYTKLFYVPQKEKRYYLEFEGMYETGMLYVNENFAGSVDYGYTRLIVDITDYLVFGEENSLVVKTYNSAQPNSRWYTGSGLYRPVMLHVGGSIRIDVDGIRIYTPEVDREIAKIVVKTSLINDENLSQIVMLHTEIRNQEGELAAVEDTPVTLYSHQSQKVEQILYVKNPALWSVDSPELYTCSVNVIKKETTETEKAVLDSGSTTFGIREIRLDPLHGLRINGEEVLLRGACIHHDHGIIGAAAFAKAEERKIRLLKKAGFNAVRIAHNSSTKALLDACDRIGMLVLDEVFDMWNHCKVQYDYSTRFARNWERDIEDLVAKDFNHPSVFMYSYGNEIQELATKSGAVWCRKLADKFRSLDPTRLVTNSINGLSALEDQSGQIAADLGILSQEIVDQVVSGEFDGDINELMTVLHGAMNQLAAHPMVGEAVWEAYSCLDACGLNYMRDCYELYAKQYPNRITFGSETLPPDIALNWKKVKELPGCIGDFTWTGWDYLGESGVGIVGYDGDETFFKPYPAYLAYVGDLDITGFRRPISYYREIVFGFRKTPYLAVQNPANYGRRENRTPWTGSDAISSWSWPGCEGKKCKIDIYSPSDEVELRINGQCVGRYPTGEANLYHAIAETTYQRGTLEAVAYNGGVETDRFMLQTADSHYKLLAECDVTVLTANQQDLAYVTISVTDENGIVHTERDFKVKVTVSGAGTLCGFGSADPCSQENFYDTVRTTFEGRVQAVIRARAEPGTVKVLIEAEECEPLVLHLRTQVPETGEVCMEYENINSSLSNL